MENYNAMNAQKKILNYRSSMQRLFLLFFIAFLPCGLSAQIYYGANEQLLVTDNAGNDPTLFVDEEISGLAIDTTNALLFFSNSSRFSNQMVEKINLDGTGREMILRDRDLNVNDIAPKGIALHESAGKVYIADGLNDGKILIVNYDGTDPQILIEGEAEGITDGITDVAIDTIHNKLYWGKRDEIMRSNLDGTDVEMVAAIDRISYLDDVALRPSAVVADPEEGLLYWADPSKKRITVTDLDGSNKTLLINTSGEPEGLQLDLKNKKIYWLEDFPFSGTAKVMYADLNGSNVIEIGSYSSSSVFTGPMVINKLEIPTSVDDELHTAPQLFALRQNYPNPFNPSTVIEFELPVSSEIRLEVFDMLGQRVALLVNEFRSSGTHQIRFDASTLSSGTYIYRLKAGDFTQTQKLTLLK